MFISSEEEKWGWLGVEGTLGWAEISGLGLVRGGVYISELWMGFRLIWTGVKRMRFKVSGCGVLWVRPIWLQGSD